MRRMPEHPGTGPAPSAAQLEWLLDRDRAFHLISAHADPMAICWSPAENLDQHQHEHRGPGTIRDHPEVLVSWDERKLEAVLEEAEEMG